MLCEMFVLGNKKVKTITKILLMLDNPVVAKSFKSPLYK